MHDQRFECPCPMCGKGELRLTTISHTAEIKHDGRLHKFQVAALHVNKCEACDTVFFDSTSHSEISQGLRDYLRLLSPQQIRDELKSLGLLQKTFAERIRVAQETISRWLSGAYIQSCAMDELMRMFFRREKEKHPNLGSKEITLPAGELTPWNRSASYQIKDVVPSNFDVGGSLPPVHSQIELDVPLEMARGPPACEDKLTYGRLRHETRASQKSPAIDV